MIGENIKHVINGDYMVIPIETGYIKPNENLNSIITPARELMEDGDYLVIAETPISVSRKIPDYRLEQIFMGIHLWTIIEN